MRFKRAPELPENLLSRRARLPKKPEPAELSGTFVRLAPLEVERDVEGLFAVSNGNIASLGERVVEAYDAEEQIWRYMSGGPFETPKDLGAWLQAQVDTPSTMCLCAFDASSGKPVGATNLMNNFPEHLKIELGNIWYSPLVQRTRVNLEATYLMLKHVFGLGYRRVEWKCDALNQRSRKAALRMGFKFEGIQEHHLIVKNRNRDTAWFRILSEEWPDIMGGLEQRLYGAADA